MVKIWLPKSKSTFFSEEAVALAELILNFLQDSFLCLVMKLIIQPFPAFLLKFQDFINTVVSECVKL